MAGLKLVSPWIEEKAAAELDALALTLDDQAAFAKLSRRLLEDLDLAAAEEPVEEDPRRWRATTPKARKAAATRRAEQGDEGTPGGGDVEMRGEEVEDESADGESTRGDGSRARRNRAAGDDLERERLRLAQPPQLGPLAGDRLQGVHDALRRDRRGRGAM